MNQIVSIRSVYINGLSCSGVVINSSEISTNIIYSLITNCQSTVGAGIHSTAKEINVSKTCISRCYATDRGSSIYTKSNIDLYMSTFCKCAPNGMGIDDNINIEEGNLNFSELNISRIHTQGATCCQYSNSKHALFNHILHSECLSESYSENNQGKIIESLFIKNQVQAKNSIFSNSSACSIIEFYDTSGTIKFENCYFSNNTLNQFCRCAKGSFPKIEFINIIISSPLNLGISTVTSSITYSTDGEMPEFFAGFSTKDCFGHYSKNDEFTKCRSEIDYRRNIVASLSMMLLNTSRINIS